MTKPTINTEYTVPYGGGSSVDGKTIYIDKRVPKKATLPGGKEVDIHFHVEIHERVEKIMIDEYGYDYQKAHKCATAAEKAAIVNDGIDWGDYQRWWAPILTRCEKDFDDPPPDLDPTPYEDSKDTQTLKKIKFLLSK